MIHSGTKFLGGHNDTLAGFLVTNQEEIKERLQFLIKTTGAGLPPFDSWLILRGIKTLEIQVQDSSGSMWRHPGKSLQNVWKEFNRCYKRKL